MQLVQNIAYTVAFHIANFPLMSLYLFPLFSCPSSHLNLFMVNCQPLRYFSPLDTMVGRASHISTMEICNRTTRWSHPSWSVTSHAVHRFALATPMHVEEMRGRCG